MPICGRVSPAGLSVQNEKDSRSLHTRVTDHSHTVGYDFINSVQEVLRWVRGFVLG